MIVITPIMALSSWGESERVDVVELGVVFESDICAKRGVDVRRQIISKIRGLLIFGSEQSLQSLLRHLWGGARLLLQLGLGRVLQRSWRRLRS